MMRFARAAAFALLVLAGQLAPARAQFNDPYNNYWSVQDASPGTQVWAGLRGQYVALADATYVAWLAAGNTVSVIDTTAHMILTLSALQATVVPTGTSTLTSGGGAIVVTIAENATLAGYLNITALSGNFGHVVMPQGNLTISPAPGRPFIISNGDGSSFTANIYDFDGVTLIAQLPAGQQLLGYRTPLGGLAATASGISFTALPPANFSANAFYGPGGAAGPPIPMTRAQAQTQLQYPVIIGGSLAAVNLNSAGSDNAITITSPTANYSIDKVQVFNTGTTASLTTATAGLFTSTGGAGLALAATQALSPITSNAIGADANMMDLATVVGSRTVTNLTTLQFRNVAAQGASASASVYVWIRPKP